MLRFKSMQEQKFRFIGAYNNFVELVINPNVVEDAKHVLIFPIYFNDLVYTKHKIRGIELPGGKVEKGETPLEAATRELYEETGGKALSMVFVAQYKVQNKNEAFTKSIFFAEIQRIDNLAKKDESTDGVVLIPINVKPTIENGFSPLVTDNVFKYVQNFIEKIR